MFGKRILWSAAAVLTVCSLLLAGCGGGTPAEGTPPATEPPAETSVTITFIGGDPESLNPLYAYSWTAECMFDLNLASLWNIDNDGNYVMELAEELPTLENGGISEDGMSVTYHLRPDAVWSDGEPLTAQDAVFTYEMIMDERNASYSRYPWDTYVASVTAVDEQTFQVQLTQPYADWSTSLFVGISRIIPQHVLQPVLDAEGTLDNAEWNRLPTVGSGPFSLTAFEPGSHLTFAANENYWRGRPQLDLVYVRLLEDRAAQIAALASGESDIGSYIVGSEIPDIETMGDMEIQSALNGYQVIMFLNVAAETAHPAMTEAQVRRAIALAIDRQLIIDQLYYGLYEIPATFWHGTVYDNPNLSPYVYDPQQAAALLDAAGWVDSNGDGVREKDGQDLELRYVYISGDETTDTMVATIQQMLGDVGIRVELYPNTYEVLWASYEDNGPMALGQYDLTHFSDGMWYFPSPDTSYFLCDQIPSAENPWGYNWYGICIPEMDELFQAQAVEMDQDQRIAMLHQIGQTMVDETLIIPLRTDPDVWAVSGRLSNVHFSGVDPLMYAYEWDVR